MTPPTGAATPLYLQWEFWSALVALAALILSQLPPILVLFKGTKLRVEAAAQIIVSHRMGNPNLLLSLNLGNVGGSDVRVRAIDFEATRGTGEKLLMPGNQYYESWTSTSAVMLTPFRLKPNEDWAHAVNFFPLLSPEEEKEQRQLSFDLRNNIMAKRALLPKDAPDVEADEKVVLPLKALYAKRNRWAPGEYTLTLNVATEPNRASVRKHYRFTLFESDCELLRGVTEQYSYGAWIIFDPPVNQWNRPTVITQLKQIPI